MKEPVQTKHVPEHRVSEAINPRTGRRERVFVNLEAVYPDIRNPSHEISFEELRAMSRGWMGKNWSSKKQPLKQISGNASNERSMEKLADKTPEQELPDQFNQKLALNDSQQSQSPSNQDENRKSKAGKSQKLKVREVKGETQTGMLIDDLGNYALLFLDADENSQNELRFPQWRQSTTQEYRRTNHDHPYSCCYRRDL